jgi:hypothetical protein
MTQQERILDIIDQNRRFVDEQAAWAESFSALPNLVPHIETVRESGCDLPADLREYAEVLCG